MQIKSLSLKIKNMKKIFLLFFLFPTFVFAQHLKFMGIPIDGDPDSFGRQLQTKGFTKTAKVKGFESDTNNKHLLYYRGKFTGEDVHVVVISTSKTNNVCEVWVIFDEEYWSDIKPHYEELKELYSTKYKFIKENKYTSTRQEDEHFRKCAYFKEENGTILLTITVSARISVFYSDTSNSEKEKEEQNSIILEDI